MLTNSWIRVAMTVAAIVLVYRYSRSERCVPAAATPWADLVLANLVGVCIVFHLGLFMYPKPWILVHAHDIYHYYMGSKYSPEVGYLDLYQATTIADAENTDGPPPRYQVRKMTGLRA